MICEWFHRFATGRYPGHYNVHLHRAVTAFTALTVFAYWQPADKLWLAVFIVAAIVANVLYETARRVDCGTYSHAIDDGADVSKDRRPGWCAHCRRPQMERSHHCHVCRKCGKYYWSCKCCKNWAVSRILWLLACKVIRFDHHVSFICLNIFDYWYLLNSFIFILYHMYYIFVVFFFNF